MSAPIIAWGSADDISGGSYSSSGTISVTGGQADPFGGTSAYLLDDNDGAATAYRYKSWVAGPMAAPPILVCAKAGTATASAVSVYDNTAAAFRGSITITWSGGVPTVGNSNGSTVIGAVDLSGSWYGILFTSASIVSGNTHRLLLVPDNSSAAGTGTCLFYIRSAALLYYPDNAVAYSVPREGSAWAQSVGNSDDAWITGTDEMLAFDARWIAALPRSTPFAMSGWDGGNESAGIGCGVKALLEQGRDRATLTYAKDRADADTNQTVTLVEPLGGAPDLEADASRRVRLTLRSATAFTGY